MRDIPKAVILWGNKDGYRETLPRLRSLCRRGEIRIVGYTQTEEIRKKTVDGFPVVSPGEINGSLCDLILIFDWRSYGAVAAFLLDQPGITCSRGGCFGTGILTWSGTDSFCAAGSAFCPTTAGAGSCATPWVWKTGLR